MGASYGREFIAELRNEITLGDFERLLMNTFQQFYQFQNCDFGFEESWSFENWITPGKCRWNIFNINFSENDDHSIIQISSTIYCGTSEESIKWFQLSGWNRGAGAFLAKKNDRVIQELKKIFRSIRIVYGNDFFHQYKLPKALFDRIDGQGSIKNTGVRLYQNF